MTGIFCGKLFRCPVREATGARNPLRFPHKYGAISAIHRQAARRHDGVAKDPSMISRKTTHGKSVYRATNQKSVSAVCTTLAMSADILCHCPASDPAYRARPPGDRLVSPVRSTACCAAGFGNHQPKMKDPSGGTTGRVKPYGRLGWMGARAEYSCWGGITAPTVISRSTRAARSKRRTNFFNLLFGSGSRKSRRNGAICRRLRPICPLPSTAGRRSAPGSRKRYRPPDRAKAFFPPA